MAIPSRGIIRRVRGSLAVRVLKFGIKRKFRLRKRAEEARQRQAAFQEQSSKVTSGTPTGLGPKRQKSVGTLRVELFEKAQKARVRADRLSEKAIETGKRVRRRARWIAGSAKR